MDFICYGDKNYEVKVRAEGSMNCVYWYANGDWITEFVQKLNVTQQAQIVLGDEHDDSSRKKSHEEEEDDTSSKSSESDDVKKMEGVMTDYMNQQLELERRIQEQEEETQNLRTGIEQLKSENHRLQEELSLLQKQKEAFVEEGDEAELNLIRLTEELSAEKQAISDQYEASRKHFEKQAQQLEMAMETQANILEEKEKEHRAEVEDLQTQIDALQKLMSSNSKFSAEQTTERELEREQFQQEIDLLQDQLEKRHDLHRSDSKLAQEVSRLEEEMETRDLAFKEQIEKMKEEEEKMKKTIQEYEENLQELREKESEQSEIDLVKGQLQEMTREREVIQQELYDNLLKVSALEAKLDQYKHNGDIPGTGAGDQSQVEQLKMNLDQEREANESKIEHLVGVQSQLRNEIMEKEEEIENLLKEIENYKELESENIKLKEELNMKEAGLVPPPSSRAEELEALSRQLLEEKNAEIDELQSRLQELESQTKKDDSSSSESSSEQKEKDSLENLEEENLRLQSKVLELEEKLASKESLQLLDVEVSEQETDLPAQEPSVPDDSVASLKKEFKILKQENEKLNAEILELKTSLEASATLFGVSPETKEKIRQLDELLGKEQDSTLDTEEMDKPSSAEEKVAEQSTATRMKTEVEEKLQELVNELKSQPKSILGRILAERDNRIIEQDSKIHQAENALTEQKENVAKLHQQVSDLERHLTEPDVKVRLRAKGKAQKGEEKEVEVEKDSDSNGESVSSTSSEDETELTEEDAHDGPDVQQHQDRAVEELKLLLDQREKEIEEKVQTIEKNAKTLAEKKEECTKLQEGINQMQNKCEELDKALQQRLKEAQPEGEMPSVANLTEEELLNVPAVQLVLARATNDLEQTLKATESEIAISKEEKDRLASDLSDVQREYMALLTESQGLQEAQEKQDLMQDRIRDLESLVAEREAELQQAQQESDDLQSNVHRLMQDIELLKQEKVKEDDKGEKVAELKDTLARKVDEFNRLLQELQQKEETIDELERQIENSKQQSKAHEDEIDLLQNEQQILNTENVRLQQEAESIQSKVAELEHVIEEKEEEIRNKEKELEVINKERFIEPHSAMLLEEGSLEEEDYSKSSSIRDEDGDSPSTEELMKMHETKMEEMKNKYSQALTKVVEDTRTQLLEEHEKKIHEMQEKHKREVAEILSESFSGENELAKKLREELDLADQLDQNLMGHLATTGVPDDVPEGDISIKLQALLDRVHNEGVQVLSLSELQFIKHYQHPHHTPSTTSTPTPPTTVEEAQQTSMRLGEDMAKLRKAWESEKLALLNAIQALKELVTQTNPNTSGDDLQESDDSRGDLLRAVSDVFERERDALIAELQTTVLEAQQSTRDDPLQEQSAKDATMQKLDALEKKLKQQGTHHTAALERLISIDRDSLLSEIRDLRNDRKQNLKQAEERIRHLESQLNGSETTNSQNIHTLQSQVERLEYKLQQERALAADVRSTLEAERVRAEDYLPALQRERDRSVELDNEIGKLQKKLAEDAEATRARTETLQAEVDDNRQHLEDLQSKLSDAREKLQEAEEEAQKVRRENDRALAESGKTVQDLKHALVAEENRRDALAKSLEDERNNVGRLHEELATFRADSHQEIETQKIKLSKLNEEIVKEKHITKDLNSAFERERETSEQLRKTLEEERALAKEARQHDRATVSDLQRILDDAKKETERVQKKMDNAERDARIAKQQLEDAHAVHQDAVESERAARDQLQSALDAVQDQKQELQKKVHGMEDELRRQNLSNLITNAGVPQSLTTPEGVMAHRRQLESLRQRLQLESTKLQDLMSKTAQRLPFAVPTDCLNQPQDEARALAAEMEQVDSVKRSLAEMQQELREMYSALSVPQRGRLGVLGEPSSFNDRLMEQNAELVTLNTQHTDEKMALRDALRRLEEEVWKAKADSEDNKSAEDLKQHQQQVQEMASRMHRLYVRYLRAESFRKALVYQKKYLLLLIGGFQDCEEATLALVARMGAYPSGDDAYGARTHRSDAFKRFRSAARVVIAVSRLKFLVKKWSRTSHSISASIQEKHGAAPILNGHHAPSSSHRRPSRSTSPNLRPVSSTSAHALSEKSPSPTPLPHYRREGYDRPISTYEPYRQTLRAAAQHMDTPPTKLTPETSYGHSGARPRNAYARSTTSPYLNSYGDQPSATALRYLNGSDRPSSRPRPRSYHIDHRSPDLSSLSYTRPGESDPSLNDYIQKLENLHHRLEQNPHRYQR